MKSNHTQITFIYYESNRPREHGITQANPPAKSKHWSARPCAVRHCLITCFGAPRDIPRETCQPNAFDPFYSVSQSTRLMCPKQQAKPSASLIYLSSITLLGFVTHVSLSPFNKYILVTKSPFGRESKFEFNEKNFKQKSKMKTYLKHI